MAAMKFPKKYEGKCVAVVNGKIVMSSTSITKLIREVRKKYPNGEAAIATVPKSSKILII